MNAEQKKTKGKITTKEHMNIRKHLLLLKPNMKYFAKMLEGT